MTAGGSWLRAIRHRPGLRAAAPRRRALAHAGGAADGVNAVEDRREVVGVERQDRATDRRGDNLTLRHGADLADALRDDEIGLQRANAGNRSEEHTSELQS